MAQGSIDPPKKLKSGKTVYYIQYYTPGGIKKHVKGGNTKREAERKLRDILDQIDKGVYAEKKDISFGELADKWLKLKAAEIRENTLAAYKPAVERLKHFPVEKDKQGNPLACLKDLKLKQVSAEHCDRFKAHLINEKNLHPWTIDRNITIMKSIFDKAIQWGYLMKSPGRYVASVPIPKKEIEALTLDEINRLLLEVDKHYQPLVLTIAMAGMRLSEALGLRWTDVDFNSRQVSIRQTFEKGKFSEPKTEKSKRAIDIPEFLAEELQTYQTYQAVSLPQNVCELVFTDEEGYPLNTDKLAQKILRPAFKLAGIKEPEKPFHALRHSYVSILGEQGEDIKYIQEQVGHSSPTVTLNIYTHVFKKRKKEAMKKLDENYRTATEHLRDGKPLIVDTDNLPAR